MATPQKVTPADIQRGHMSDEVRIRGFVWFLVVFVGFAIVSNLVLYWVFGILLAGHERPEVSPLAESHATPPEPRLQGSAVHPPLPDEDLKTLEAAQQQELRRYGWVNQDAGIARVPIERAMEILVAQGLPTSRPSSQ